MALHPLDLLVLLKLVAWGKRGWNYRQLSDELGVSTSQLHAAIRRSIDARLMLATEQPGLFRPHVREFLIYGAKYVFPAEEGMMTRGIPTGYAAPPLNALIAPSSDPPPVWPFADGTVRGTEHSPIHKAAPAAALKDRQLYELLALFDALRTGRARERGIAKRELARRI